MPDEEFYEDYPQLDNGVGMWTLMKTEFLQGVDELEEQEKDLTVSFAVGVAAYPLFCSLAEALEENRLGAFCADVMTVEPPAADNKLQKQPNAYITPHIAWASTEARVRLIQVATENVRCFINGKPQNMV
jgi:hypothetical protein